MRIPDRHHASQEIIWLPSMTPKQQLFAQMVASGQPLSGAYRAAYSAQAMKPSSVHVEASRIMKLKPVKDKVASLVAESDKQIVNDRIAKREEVLEELTRLMQEAQPSDTPKIRAAELLGKHHGIFAERIVVGPPERTSDELADEIRQILKAAGNP